MHSLIVFASGRGSNAAAIHDYFQQHGKAAISLVVTNKAEAGVLPWAAGEGIPTKVITRGDFNDPAFVAELQSFQPSLIVLAGFLWKIPEALVAAFPDKIINIHPALLPSYGGKGMWGDHVHNAVLAASEKESGITIHRVNEHYDEGNILLQARCPVAAGDTASSLGGRIHRLEHFYYPRVIEFLLEA